MTFGKKPTPRKPTKPAKWQIPTRRTRWGKNEYYLEGELRDKFVRLFPIHSNIRLMRWFGVSFSTIHRFRRELGLSKDMKAIYREHARDVKRVCERNGYYASLRGRAPSEACVEATRRLRAGGFVPMTRLRETNPRKYRRVCRKRAEAWRETRRKERGRVALGLPQKTKFRIVLHPMSHAAYAQKHAMIKQNNYFADPDHSSWVCYDAETRRSPRREATAVRHGLRVVPADE